MTYDDLLSSKGDAMSDYMSMIGKDILYLVDRVNKTGVLIGLEEYKTLCMNSYERHYILKYLSDEVIYYMCRYAQGNSVQPGGTSYVTWGIVSTYDESLKFTYVDELIRRLRRINILYRNVLKSIVKEA